MTKLETIAYYEAINADDRLVVVDNTDTIEQITSKLKEIVSNDKSETIHIEVFQNDKNVTSYSLIKFSDDVYTLWEQRNSCVNNENIETVSQFVFDNLPAKIQSPYDRYVAEKLSNGNILIKSYIDDNYQYELNPRDVPMDIMDGYILGQYLLDDGRLEYHPVNHADTSRLKNLLDEIEDDRIRIFAETLLPTIPDYIFQIPAGISGAVNSASDLTKEGLLRHIENAVTIYKIFTSSEYAKIKFTQHERDMMYVATIFCDAFKHGWQENYEESHLPKYEHPKIAADVIRSINGILSVNEINFIANCIESHMGHSVDNKPDGCTFILPAPDTEYKHLVLLVQYLASQKDIIIRNNDTIHVFDTDTITTVKSYTVVSSHDINTLKNALDKPIDMELAKSLGIKHSAHEIIDVWKTIIASEKASDKHIKYIELAKKMIFE